jgi:hypothetical protein
MTNQLEALRLAATLDTLGFDFQTPRLAADELRRLLEVNAELVKALKSISHSVKQAQISGNDWRRELNLCENIANQTLAKATGESNA